MIEVLSIATSVLLAGMTGILLGQWWTRRQSAEERSRWNNLPDYGGQISALKADIRALRPQGTVLLRLPTASSGGEEDAAVDVARHLESLDSRLAALEASLLEMHRTDATKMKRTDAAALLERISVVEAAISALPAPDLSPLNRRIDETQALLRSIEPPPAADLKPVYKQLNTLLDAVQCIRLPEPADLKPLQRQVTALQEAVGQIHIPDAVDLKPVQKHVAAVESAVHAIEIPRPPDPVDLSPVREKIGHLAGLVQAIRIPPPPDLTWVQTKLAKIEQAIYGIEIPTPLPAPDLVPLSDGLARLEQMVGHLPAPADLSPIRRKLNNIEERIVGLPIPDPVDVKPLQKQVASVKEALYEIRRSERPRANAETNSHTDHVVSDPSAVATEALHHRLDDIERTISERPQLTTNDLHPIQQQLARLDAHISRVPTAAPSPTTSAAPEVQPTLFESADAGPADDLKQISGIGPALEKALNRVGVWYLWQIANWNEEQVNYVDRRLGGAKGRIRRYDWVAQALELAKTSDRRPPTETNDGVPAETAWSGPEEKLETEVTKPLNQLPNDNHEAVQNHQL